MRVYRYNLVTLLSRLDYGCVFTNKGKDIREGLAFFYNKKRFKLIETKQIIFFEELSTNPLYCDFWVALSKNDKLLSRILELGTALQVNVIESLDCNEVIVVANTHLYFNEDANHIRLIHAGMAIKYLENHVATLKKKVSSSNIFCL